MSYQDPSVHPIGLLDDKITDPSTEITAPQCMFSNTEAKGCNFDDIRLIKTDHCPYQGLEMGRRKRPAQNHPLKICRKKIHPSCLTSGNACLKSRLELALSFSTILCAHVKSCRNLANCKQVRNRSSNQQLQVKYLECYNDHFTFLIQIYQLQFGLQNIHTVSRKEANMTSHKHMQKFKAERDTSMQTTILYCVHSRQLNSCSILYQALKEKTTFPKASKRN